MMKKQISESDLEQLFIVSRYKNKRPWFLFLRFFGLFILFFFLIFIGLNFPAFKQKLSYFWQDEFSAGNQLELEELVTEAGAPESSATPNIADNSIYIESINTKAPIIFSVSDDESSVAKNLENGVIQLTGSALPGENGNIFITGHSSNYLWAKGNYNSVFALLDKVVVGDLVLVKFQNSNYIYRISDKFITNASDISVIDKYKSTPTLTLMTCTPVGTNLRRLILRSDQIVPDPQNAAAQKNNESVNSLPEIH